MGTSHAASGFGKGRFRRGAAFIAALLLTICGAQQATAAMINVTTTDQGVTNNQCSLQEAIYASVLRSSTAVRSTNPDVFYNTGCTAGTGDDTIMLPAGAVFTFNQSWDADRHNY